MISFIVIRIGEICAVSGERTVNCCHVGVEVLDGIDVFDVFLCDTGRFSLAEIGVVILTGKPCGTVINVDIRPAALGAGHAGNRHNKHKAKLCITLVLRKFNECFNVEIVGALRLRKRRAAD